MAKDKIKTGVPNKHLHARISYLQQASTHLATATVDNSASTARTKSRKTQELRGEFSAPVDLTAPLPTSEHESQDPATQRASEDTLTFQSPAFGGLPLHLSSHLLQLARKSQIRLHPSIKHSVCKRCGTPLIDGQTCTKTVENQSRGELKPHADVLVVECASCGATKRFPVRAERQDRKAKRAQKAQSDDRISKQSTAKT